ncbi:MAG: ComEC/Rec2 family competence protein [Alphaproteobacteria bacterium]|nr:ComEC/Rec2 family competence protein [Alphaproteobacteria bacterium]
MKINLWAEYPNRRLWYFMAFAFGCATYFGLNFEPDLVLCCVLSIVLGIWSYCYKTAWRWVLFFFIFGISVATCRTHFIHTNIISEPLWRQEIGGRVIAAMPRENGQSVILDDIQIVNNTQNIKRARFNFSEKTPAIQVGDEIQLLGHLYSPLQMQRQRFFYQKIEAQGRVLQLLNHTPKNRNWIDDWRHKIMFRLQELLSSDQAQIAVPLVVGEQQIVSQKLYDIYRKAGIAHILSVSGFHMVLLAGFVFFLIRGLLCLVPAVVLRINTKKVAAVAALAVTGLYLLLSGCQVPAIRSFLMIALVFLAVLTDRRVWSLYSLLLIGFVLLLFRPEWIASVSFQLSFVAVLVLVGLLESVYRWLPAAKLYQWFLAALCANMMVTIALAPFIIYHFNQFNPYGVVGNLLTTIFFSFCIMPLLFVGTILMPFGWDAPFIKMAGFVLDKMTNVAEMVASWPGAEILLPKICAVGLGVFTLGLSVLCLLKNKYKLLGVPVCVVGICVGFFFAESPDILVSNKGRVVAVRQRDSLGVIGDSSYWQVARWARLSGNKKVEPLAGADLTIKGYKIAFQTDSCRGADLAIVPYKKGCFAKRVLVPKKNETYQIYLNKGIRILNERFVDKNRPWGAKYERSKNEI